MQICSDVNRPQSHSSVEVEIFDGKRRAWEVGEGIDIGPECGVSNCKIWERCKLLLAHPKGCKQ
jgi:hypothetical protein